MFCSPMWLTDYLVCPFEVYSPPPVKYGTNRFRFTYEFNNISE